MYFRLTRSKVPKRAKYETLQSTDHVQGCAIEVLNTVKTRAMKLRTMSRIQAAHGFAKVVASTGGYHTLSQTMIVPTSSTTSTHLMYSVIPTSFSRKRFPSADVSACCPSILHQRQLAQPTYLVDRKDVQLVGLPISISDQDTILLHIQQG